MAKEIIATTNAPGAVGPYVQAVKDGQLVDTTASATSFVVPIFFMGII